MGFSKLFALRGEARGAARLDSMQRLLSTFAG